jgi:hypothetical protein
MLIVSLPEIVSNWLKRSETSKTDSLSPILLMDDIGLKLRCWRRRPIKNPEAEVRRHLAWEGAAVG